MNCQNCDSDMIIAVSACYNPDTLNLVPNLAVYIGSPVTAQQALEHHQHKYPKCIVHYCLNCRAVTLHDLSLKHLDAKKHTEVLAQTPF